MENEQAATVDTPIPVTTAEFDLFCKEIFEEHGYPDKPGYRQMVASMIMHEPETTVTLSKKRYAAAIKKAQANEVAYWVIQETNKEMKAEEERQKLEASEPEQDPAAS